MSQSPGDMHRALKTSILQQHVGGGIDYRLVRLQDAKDSFRDTLHARPNTHSTHGIQTADLLSLIGFERAPCAFHQSECFCRMTRQEIDLRGLSEAMAQAYAKLQIAERHLGACGMPLPQPEGWGFYYGKPATNRRHVPDNHRGDGHVASTIEQMKVAQDDHFEFRLTWLAGPDGKGWTTHYRAKHMPLADEFQMALDFLGGFRRFADCPEFNFESCWWRFTAYRPNGNDPFEGNAEFAHRCFDAHADNFSAGLRALLDAHAVLAPYDMSFLLAPKSTLVPRVSPASKPATAPRALPTTKPNLAPARQPYTYDVAFSFAGTERTQVEVIARAVRDAGFNVFYDDFYPEQLWGKDLAAHFDRIYRKESKFCVLFISREYATRLWTTLERRSATARAVTERGNDYILPIRVDDTDIDGLIPTLGHLSLAERTPGEIAEMLIKRLQSST